MCKLVCSDLYLVCDLSFSTESLFETGGLERLPIEGQKERMAIALRI
jgi:hypothetical protein